MICLINSEHSGSIGICIKKKVKKVYSTLKGLRGVGGRDGVRA